MNVTTEELSEISGIGSVIAKAYVDYFAEEKHRQSYLNLLAEVKLPEPEVVDANAQIFAGKNFVITGSVEHFANRSEIKELIESKGGKVTGSVTSKTTYLINNDVTSSSSKNKKAKELGVPIISEQDFLSLLEA
jgi:DNA ligase (NAD+)